MKSIYSLIVIMTMCTLGLRGQSMTSMQVEFSVGGQLLTEVTAQKGWTMYSLSKATGVDVQTILDVNQKSTTALSLNEKITLPISQDHISSAPASNAVALYYQVKKSQNLYQIARSIGQKPNYLMTLNGLSTPDISIDQQLLLGWMSWPYSDNVHEQTYQPVASVEQPLQAPPAQTIIYAYPKTNKPRWIRRIKNKEVFTNQTINSILASYDVIEMDNYVGSTVTERGIAYWQKGKAGNEMIVMHSNAKVNSKISLYNPMLKRSVSAKVVSDLPKGTYPKDVSVVISPSVAQALGALDSRFLVEITYIE